MLWWAVGLGAVVLVLYYLMWKDADPSSLKPSDFKWNPDNLEEKQEVPTREKIAVVGAGFCGLGIAGAFTRHGIPYDVLEMDNDVGGNWYHGVYETVHIISSRKTTEYKDVPMPADWPDFPSADQVLTYLRSYAERYQIKPHCKFNTEVVHVRPIGKGKDTTGWEVELADGSKSVYKGVVIAVGHHWSKRMPTYEGMATFTGESIHSKDYKNPAQLKGKRVLVVGGGNSACDIAVEAARFGASSHVSHRRGYWFLPRSVMGIPFVDVIKPWMPLWFQRTLLRLFLKLSVGPYESYGLQKPDHAIFEHHPTINSELLHYIKLGRIRPHPDIAKITDDTVQFVDGTSERFDMIVYATGYNLAFPMVDKEVVPEKDGVPQLVSGLIAEGYKHLYIFGITQVRYGAGPLITAGAESLALIIKAQDRLTHPVASVLGALGIARKPKRAAKSADILADPHALYLNTMLARWFTPKLPAIEPWLARLGRL